QGGAGSPVRGEAPGKAAREARPLPRRRTYVAKHTQHYFKRAPLPWREGRTAGDRKGISWLGNEASQLFLMGRPRDLGIAPGVVDIDLAPDPKATRKVDPGLDTEEGAWENEARVVGFEIIEVRAVPVPFLVNGVAGAMDEALPMSCSLNDLAG